MTRRLSLTPNSNVDGMETTRVHSKIIYNTNARAGLITRAASILGVLGRTSATVLRALSKTVRMIKRCKLVILIKFSIFLQAVSLQNPFACIQKSRGSAMEHLGSLDP